MLRVKRSKETREKSSVNKMKKRRVKRRGANERRRRAKERKRRAKGMLCYLSQVDPCGFAEAGFCQTTSAWEPSGEVQALPVNSRYD